MVCTFAILGFNLYNQTTPYSTFTHCFGHKLDLYTVEGVFSVSFFPAVSLSFFCPQVWMFLFTIYNKYSQCTLTFLKWQFMFVVWVWFKKDFKVVDETAWQKPWSDPLPASSLQSGSWEGYSVNQAGTLPLAPLAPVLRCEVKAFWIYAQVSLLHCSFMPIHNILWKRQDILTLDSRDKAKSFHVLYRILWK